MRILNICAYTWEIGGPARIIYDHATEAVRQGHEVAILSPMSAQDKLYPAPEGVRVITCLRTPIISRIYREFSRDLLTYLRKHIHEYDIIHVHGIWHFGSLAPFLIRRRGPVVITIHGLLDRWAIRHSAWKKKLVSLLFQKRLLEKAALVQVNNRDEEEDVIRYLGHTPDRMAIIPNGMRMSDYDPLPPEGGFIKHFSIPPGYRILLFMGRLNIKKGLDLLLPAFRLYHQKHPDTKLVLAGPDDGYESEAARYISENGLENAVVRVGMLTGPLKKMALADADVFVLPTYSEGFSIAVLEAMASRLPVVVSDRTGFGDYTRRYNAAAVTALTVESLAASLEKTLTDAAFRREIADNAYRMVAENFDIRVVAGRLLSEYEKILAVR